MIENLVENILNLPVTEYKKSVLPKVCDVCGADRVAIFCKEKESDVLALLFLLHSTEPMHPFLSVMFPEPITPLFGRSIRIKTDVYVPEIRQTLLDWGVGSCFVCPIHRSNMPTYFFVFFSTQEENIFNEKRILMLSAFMAVRFSEERLKKEATLERFLLSTASHEVRTQLNAVIALTEALRASKLTASQSEKMALLQQSSVGILYTLNNTLDYGKIKAGRFETHKTPFDIQETIQNIVSICTPLAQKNNTTIDTKFVQISSSFILGDSTRFRQVVFNLLSNAIKFTKQGQITVLVKRITPEIRRPETPEFFLKISVIDTGKGISEKAKEVLFSQYAQDESVDEELKSKGTGLGLYISKSLVGSFGGQMGFESQQNHGSTFWFTIPFIELMKNKTHTALDIFLLEDDLINIKYTKTLLTSLGHKVTVARTEKEATQKVQDKTFDLALLDMHLPDGNGVSVLLFMRSLPHLIHTEIFAYTASVNMAEKSICMDAGFEDFLSKPLDKDIIKAILDRLSIRKALALHKPKTRDKNVIDISKILVFKESIGKEGFDVLVLEFIDHSFDLLNTLSGAVKELDYGLIYSSAHNLKSCTAIFGLTKVSAYASLFETEGKKAENGFDVLKPLLEDLKKEYGYAMYEFQKYIPKKYSS